MSFISDLKGTTLFHNTFKRDSFCNHRCIFLMENLASALPFPCDKITKFKSYDVTGPNILPNSPKSKFNQTMKFGQSIEYIMRNILLEKSYTRCDEQTSSRPFSEKLKLSISLFFLLFQWISD